MAEKMEKPLVSVVTITRNRGNMIGRCIDSVLSQTYSNIEHIIVDGASDDNTDEVVANFKDERLKYIKLESNWPIKETIDYGVSMCQGKYLTFLDSDDEYVPTKIQKQVELIESLPEDYGFIYCWMTYFDSSNNNSIIRVHNPQLRGYVADEVVGEPVISGTPTLMFRSSFFNKLGGWKSLDEIGMASDTELCVRACQLSKVDFIPESLVNVYENHGSVRQSEGKYYKDPYKRLVKFHKYFLTTFADNYKRRPEKASYHCYLLAVSYYHLGEYFQCVKYFLRAFRLNPQSVINKFVK